METIKNYLESMFLNLPNTPEVQKAKYELGQMMEDKYLELINEGKSDNEAIGIVISEFGNLSELAQDLGITSYMQNGNPVAGRQITLDEVKDYLSEKSKQAYMVALGVMLCIMSVIGPIIGGVTFSGVGGAVGVAVLFLMIAVAVGLFIFSGVIISKWDYFSKERCNTDFETTTYVHERKESFRTTYALMLTIGIILCVISFIPMIIIDQIGLIHRQMVLYSAIGISSLFVMIGIGVFLIVSAAIKKGGYTTILQINSQSTVGGNYVASQNGKRYNNKTVATIMSVYWPTVTCIYLCWSFLSFDWHITWIIWVIAAVVELLIKNIFTDNQY